MLGERYADKCLCASARAPSTHEQCKISTIDNDIVVDIGFARVTSGAAVHRSYERLNLRSADRRLPTLHRRHEHIGARVAMHRTRAAGWCGRNVHSSSVPLTQEHRHVGAINSSTPVDVCDAVDSNRTRSPVSQKNGEVATVHHAIAVEILRTREATVLHIAHFGRTRVDAVKDAILVGIRFSDGTTAEARLDLVGIRWATVVAIGCAIAIAVGVGNAATACAWCGLEWITWAGIVAVRGAVAVAVGVGNAATACSRCNLVCVVGTTVVAIRGAIAIAVGVGNAATACAGCCLVCVVGATVVAIRGAVAVAVSVGNAAATCAG